VKRVLALVVALAALGAGAYAAIAATSTTKLALSEKEFKILPTAVKSKAGKVTFTVRNTGRLTHEFIVLKTNLAPTKLPVKSAKAVLVGKVYGQLKSVKPGRTGVLTLTLPKAEAARPKTIKIGGAAQR
jgi:uncharacterized cupredoxin-like copper-binding protein